MEVGIRGCISQESGHSPTTYALTRNLNKSQKHKTRGVGGENRRLWK